MDSTTILLSNILHLAGTWIRGSSNSTKIRTLIFSLFSFVFAIVSFAQTSILTGGSVVIKRLSIEQGLSSRLVRSITQDSRGFIWIGTFDGVNRYDGEKFTSIRSGNDSIALSHWDVWGGVCGDRDGIVWIGTTRGLNKFIPATRSFKKYFRDARDTKSLSSDSINCVFIDREGTLWVGTSFGLNKLNRESDTWTRYFPNLTDSSRPGENYISTILEDQRGKLWIAAGGSNDLLTGGGLFTLDRTSGKFTPIGPRVGIRTVYEDRSGDLWVSLVGPRLCKIDKVTGEFVTIPLPPRDEGNPRLQGIRGICEDKSGFLWMATSSWSLLRYDKQQKTFTRFSYDPQNPESISSTALNTIFADKEGVVWVGTDRGGVNTVSIKPFKHIHSLGSSLHLSGRVDVVFQDREGYLWVAHQKGLWRFNPETGKSVCILPKGLVMTILQDNDGIIWIADRFSVVRYDPKTKRSKIVWKAPLVRGVQSRLIKIMFDREKDLWVGCNDALYRVNKDMKTYTTFVHNPRDSQSISFGLVKSLGEDRSGNIWVGTQKGVSRFEKKTRTFTRILHDEKDSTSISNTDNANFYTDRRGMLWIGTDNGLNRYDEGRGSFQGFYYSDKRNRTSITPLQEDTMGNFWYASVSKIYKFDVATGTFTGFDRSDGIEDVEILFYSCTRLKSGEFLYGTNDGILMFHPDNVYKSRFLPPIVITGIKKLHQQVRIKSAPELLREISFNHEENVFSISFSALSYDMPEFNQYAYKLEGFDKDWVICGNRREAMYTNLDPGTYTFRAKGSNHDGIWNESGTSLTVIIKPAYWQTWWFRSLIIVAALSLIGFIFRREVNRLKKDKRIQQEFSKKQIESQEAERKRLASELHDGLGQNLLVVNNELQQFIADRKASQKDIRRVASMVQESVESVREISSNLHPHHIERLGFCAAVEALVENVSHSSGLKMESTCDKLDHQMPKEIEIHVYRIIQESLSNIVRHASARNARVEVRKSPKSIDVTIKDDGHGFDMHEFRGGHAPKHNGDVSRGFGLASMSERARIIDGTLTIDSSVSSGTTIHLTLPRI